MTDEELIARLRAAGKHPMMDSNCKVDVFVVHDTADRIEALIAERDHWSGVARREGVCMTCCGPRGAPEPYGCSDCLNTGYCGEYHNTVADLEDKLAKAVEALERIEGQAFRKARATARTTLAEIKGESHE